MIAGAPVDWSFSAKGIVNWLVKPEGWYVGWQASKRKYSLPDISIAAPIASIIVLVESPTSSEATEAAFEVIY